MIKKYTEFLKENNKYKGDFLTKEILEDFASIFEKYGFSTRVYTTRINGFFGIEVWKTEFQKINTEKGYKETDFDEFYKMVEFIKISIDQLKKLLGEQYTVMLQNDGYIVSLSNNHGFSISISVRPTN